MEKENKKSFRETIIDEIRNIKSDADVAEDRQISVATNALIANLDKAKSDDEAKRVIEHWKNTTNLFDVLKKHNYDLSNLSPKFESAMLSIQPLVAEDRLTKSNLMKTIGDDVFLEGSESNWKNLNKYQLQDLANKLETTPEELTNALEKHQTRVNRETSDDFGGLVAKTAGDIFLPRTMEEYYETGDWSAKNLGKDIAEDVIYAGTGAGLAKAGKVGAKALPKVASKTKKLLSNNVGKTLQTVASAAKEPLLVETMEQITGDNDGTFLGDLAAKTMTNFATPAAVKMLTGQTRRFSPEVSNLGEKLLTSNLAVNKFGDMSGTAVRKSEAARNMLGNVPGVKKYLEQKDKAEKIKQENKTKAEKIEKLRRLGLADFAYIINEDE